MTMYRAHVWPPNNSNLLSIPFSHFLQFNEKLPNKTKIQQIGIKSNNREILITHYFHVSKQRLKHIDWNRGSPMHFIEMLSLHNINEILLHLPDTFANRSKGYLIAIRMRHILLLLSRFLRCRTDWQMLCVFFPRLFSPLFKVTHATGIEIQFHSNETILSINVDAVFVWRPMWGAEWRQRDGESERNTLRFIFSENELQMQIKVKSVFQTEDNNSKNNKMWLCKILSEFNKFIWLKITLNSHWKFLLTDWQYKYTQFGHCDSSCHLKKLFAQLCHK